MRASGDQGAFLLQCLEEGQTGPYAKIIADLESPISFFERGVEITANENFFTSEISEFFNSW
jgi:hypothetical protein